MSKRKLIKIIIDIYSYSMGMGIAFAMGIILISILNNGKGIGGAWHSTGDFLLWVEIILVFSFIPFCIYKFFRNTIDRDKIEGYELK